MPEMRGTPSVLFAELIDGALTYSKLHHADHRNVVSRLGVVNKALGRRPAASIMPADIQAFLSEKTNTPTTSNR
jgi:hypothetical protein